MCSRHHMWKGNMMGQRRGGQKEKNPKNKVTYRYWAWNTVIHTCIFTLKLWDPGEHGIWMFRQNSPLTVIETRMIQTKDRSIWVCPSGSQAYAACMEGNCVNHYNINPNSWVSGVAAVTLHVAEKIKGCMAFRVNINHSFSYQDILTSL